MISALHVLAFLAVISSAPMDTVTRATGDTVVAPVGPRVEVAALGARPVEDTVRPRRRRSVEVSELYETRLRIHRIGSYLIYPLFVTQAIAGNQIIKDPRNAPDWAKTTHRTGAAALAGVFTLNTVTGLWNLWDSRSVEQARTKRILHGLLMLASDAGFTYAGVKLSEEAETSEEKRRDHRNMAYGSMAATLAGIGVIKYWPED